MLPLEVLEGNLYPEVDLYNETEQFNLLNLVMFREMCHVHRCHRLTAR